MSGVMMIKIFNDRRVDTSPDAYGIGGPIPPDGGGIPGFISKCKNNDYKNVPGTFVMRGSFFQI